MQTLIFAPSEYGMSGYMEIFENGNVIKLRYGFKSENIEEKNLYKLYALCKSKPNNAPVPADTAEFKNGYAQAEREFTAAALKEFGYAPDELDTFVLVKKNPITADVRVCAKCFKNDEWDAEKVFEYNDTVNIINPLNRARDTLEAIKQRTCTKDAAVSKRWISEVQAAVKEYPRLDVTISDKYTWYKINSVFPPVNLSSYMHLLFVTEVAEAVYRSGYYIFGVNIDGHTAVAVKSCGNSNPFVNADDCCVKIGGFFTVGIYLASDGQYFEKIEQ